ncbi:uncharacterized protein ASCRUDRAFT_70577 [Ascoidea rubescens DSM 1968]|uniref:Uncharacterized protein n=1 Tax=Ascoidea rubescens DSM 1968 TaxID=1344418 RepID=A0A1D2VGC8_9ASCO|nr:hypothetical protein ASCRUDRAFT_70577 [Ascoidea rubescens DSM 1968]ODV60696.1 hypothetical protein ASCRUDRAFT_70577 [Ascoidea rubescens DSM 1968]
MSSKVDLKGKPPKVPLKVNSIPIKPPKAPPIKPPKVKKVAKPKKTFQQMLNELPDADVILKYFWITGHSLALMGFLLYFATMLSRSPLPMIWYTFSFIGCIITYSTVIIRRYLLIVRKNQSVNVYSNFSKLISVNDLVRSENFLFLATSFLYLFSPMSFFKILPFGLFSLLNLMNYLVKEVFRDYSISRHLIPLLKFFEKPSRIICSHIDFFVLIPIIFLQSVFINHHFYQLVFFLQLWFIKLESIKSQRTVFYSLIYLVDTLISILQDKKVKINPVVLTKYNRFKLNFEKLLPLDPSYKTFSTSNKLPFSLGNVDDDTSSLIYGQGRFS